MISRVVRPIIHLARKIRDKVRQKLTLIRSKKLVYPPQHYLEKLRVQTANSTLPSITVITPIYKTPPNIFIEMIESVTAQVYRNWELILIDDGSKNNSLTALMQKYIVKDSRIKLITLEKNVGISEASNAGIAASSGELIAFLDHDDVLLPHSLAEVALAFQASPEAIMAYTDSAVISEAGKLQHLMVKPIWSPEFFLSTSYPVHLCILKRSFLNETGALKTDPIYQSCQDVELEARLLNRPTHQVIHINKILYLWRLLPGSTSTSFEAKSHTLLNIKNVLQSYLKAPLKLMVPYLAYRYKACLYQHTIEETAATLTLKDEITVLILDYGLGLVAELSDHYRDLGFAVQTQKINEPLNTNLKTSSVFVTSETVLGSNVKNILTLLGYLKNSEDIIAAGPKILDVRNHVIGGAYILLDEPQVLNRNMQKDDTGYWFNNVITTNASALTGDAFICKTSAANTILEGLTKYGPYFPIPGFASLRKKNKRIIYAASIEVYARDRSPWTLDEKKKYFKNLVRDQNYSANDPYYSKFFSNQNAFHTNFDFAKELWS